MLILSLAVAAIGLVTTAVRPLAAPATTVAALSCPARPTAAVGLDFSGRLLAFQNFAHRRLVNASFRGATLQGTMFIGADLTGADFSGAHFIASGRPGVVNDLTLATLDSACFIGATFEAPTDLTHATLSCADFSQTDLGGGNAVFGDTALRIDTVRPCRLAFRQATLDCEFVRNWKDLDLTGAKVAQCTGADLAGVDLQGAMLDGVNLFQANLEGAQLDGAQLHGATLSYANLKNATLRGAHLGIDPAKTGTQVAGTLYGAYMPGADLSNADLRTVDLTGAHIYDSDTRKTSFAGTRLDSATLTRALLPNAVFTGSLTNATFTDAVLINARFAGSDLGGAKFDSAYLQGADFSGVGHVSGASLGNAGLSNAKGTWSFTESDGTPYAIGYGASVLGPFASAIDVTCPNGDYGGCTGVKLVPAKQGPYPAQPACIPVGPKYDNCLPPKPP